MDLVKCKGPMDAEAGGQQHSSSTAHGGARHIEMQYFWNVALLKFYDSTSTDLPQRVVALDEQVGDVIVGGAAAICGARKQRLPQDRLPLQAAPCSGQCVSMVCSNRCTIAVDCRPRKQRLQYEFVTPCRALKWRRQ